MFQPQTAFIKVFSINLSDCFIIYVTALLELLLLYYTISIFSVQITDFLTDKALC